MNTRHIFISLIVGAVVAYLYFVPPLKAELAAMKASAGANAVAYMQEKDKPPPLPVETSSAITAGYAPKEDITYTDAQTGKTVTTKENTDIDMTLAEPDIYMRFNNKNYKLPGQPSEKYKFENGKFMANIATNTVIDVTELVEKQVAIRMSNEQPLFTVGGYLTNKGIVASAGLVNKKYEYKVMASIPKISKFYGIGFEKKF